MLEGRLLKNSLLSWLGRGDRLISVLLLSELGTSWVIEGRELSEIAGGSTREWSPVCRLTKQVGEHSTIFGELSNSRRLANRKTLYQEEGITH